MPITNIAQRRIIRAIDQAFQQSLEWLNTSAMTTSEGKKITGNKLFRRIFGSSPIIQHTVSLSPEAERIQALLLPTIQQSRYSTNKPITVFPSATLPRPVTSASFSLMIRDENTVDKPDGRKVRLSQIVLNLPITQGIVHPITNLIRETTYSGLKFGWMSGEACPTAITHEHFTPLIQECYGEEFLQGLERVISFYDLVSNVSSDLGSYMEKCKSLAGLYHKLPILNTFLPNSNLEHVTFTRNTPKPPDNLGILLNSLASVYAACIQATGGKS